MGDWTPMVRKPAPIAPPEVKASAPPQVVVVKETQTQRPSSWVFTPVRNSDNLIIEIIAEPRF